MYWTLFSKIILSIYLLSFINFIYWTYTYVTIIYVDNLTTTTASSERFPSNDFLNPHHWPGSCLPLHSNYHKLCANWLSKRSIIGVPLLSASITSVFIHFSLRKPFTHSHYIDQLLWDFNGNFYWPLQHLFAVQ